MPFCTSDPQAYAHTAGQQPSYRAGSQRQSVGPVKQRDRGFGAGELLTGIAAAQLAGEDFLTGLDRQRADAAGQQITPVPGLASTTAASLARRLTPGQWRAVESGLAVVTGRMLSLLPAERVTALAGGPVTIDLDTTYVEVSADVPVMPRAACLCCSVS